MDLQLVDHSYHYAVVLNSCDVLCSCEEIVKRLAEIFKASKVYWNSCQFPQIISTGGFFGHAVSAGKSCE